MSSAIDATVPADDVKADKALLRSNFQTAKDEITGLQLITSRARKMAYDDAQFDAI